MQLCEDAPKDRAIEPKEWKMLNPRISQIVSSVGNSRDLADLALWCDLSTPVFEEVRDRKFIFVNARDACIFRIGTPRDESAKSALQKVRRNLLVDGMLSKQLRNAETRLGVPRPTRVALFNFESPKEISELPISPSATNYRSSTIDSFWDLWSKNQHIWDRCGRKQQIWIKMAINGSTARLVSLTFNDFSRLTKESKISLESNIRTAIDKWKPPESKYHAVSVTVKLTNP